MPKVKSKIGQSKKKERWTSILAIEGILNVTPHLEKWNLLVLLQTF